MEPDTRIGTSEGEKPRRCLACGTPYPEGDDELGCPVCLFRQAFGPESSEEPSPVAEHPPGEENRFDHYELVRREDGAVDELGRGAMGVTYKAFDTVLGHAVALKVLDARIAARLDVRERFLREARATARLRHPHVASVLYFGVRKSDSQCFYAMELVEGETLEARLRREGPLPVSLALAVTSQVSRALAAAEVQGVVHRDLKPSNLMLVSGPELIVKVIDFGMAKVLAGPDPIDLTYGGFVGTPAFASPEQFSGVGVDGRADLYSLGVTLWEMLTGQTPFRGSRTQVMHQHLHAALPLERLQGIPQPVVVLLQALLEKDPGLRFQNPAELFQALPAVTGAVEADRTLTRHGLQKAPATNWDAAARKKPTPRRGPKRISVARLPVTGKEVFGREEDLTFLEAAWADPQVNVVTIVAWAGVGKSTLVNHWLWRMAADRYRSAELVFGWSFYRQGTGEGVASSADEFLDAALAWFGDADPRLGTAWEKGERLARLIAARRTLLVLDGLEPLQHPPGPHEGRLREPSLQALLRELAAFNKGLCVITTRLPVADVADHEGASVLHRDLDHLSQAAGSQLLRALGVKGPETELRRASDEFGGHCLALTLLGSYLTDAYEGNIRCRHEVSNRLAHDVRQGVHARKVMASYQSWWGEGPELSVLRLLGLFDRPVEEKALRALLKLPAIQGLTESLTALSPSEWRTLLARLRRAKLLTGEDPHHPGQVDTHPLVREYFGEQLRGQHTTAWQEGNRRLYHHYRALAPALPETFRDMEALFLAVICACHAGLFRDALHEVYLPRIQRNDASFADKILGARGALLSALAHFFEDGRWGSLAKTNVEGQSLTAEDQLFIFMQAALHLTVTRGLGAPEAQICHERAEALCHSLKRTRLLHAALMGRWRHSLITDKLTATMQIAERVYALAQEENDPELIIGACRALAAPLYFLGNFEAARRYAMHGVQLWRAGDVPSLVEEVHSPAVLCLCYVAVSGWQLGERASCHTTMAEAISLAKALNDIHTLTAALYFAAALNHFERNHTEVERLASEIIELSTRQHYAFWLPGGEIFRGWARSVAGKPTEGVAWIEDGIRGYRATGSTLNMPYYLALKAEALHLLGRVSEALEAINEAEALAESSGEAWWSAELHRLRGMFLTEIQADEAQIEASLCAAIRTATQQNSISLAVRAETACAEHRSRRATRSTDT